MINQIDKFYKDRSHIDFIQEQVSLSDKNWFETGGNARYFAQPATAEEFLKAIDFANQSQIPIFVLGSGANSLISDNGFDGLIICPALKNIRYEGESNDQRLLIGAQAGVTIDELIRWSLDHNLLGLEEFSGIPGTVGGSIYINLHYFQFLISQFLVSAQVVHRSSGKISIVDCRWFNFGYDYSKLYSEEFYLLSATFLLKKATDIEIAYARGRREEIIRHRLQRYPHKNTCGSFFRNFHDHEVSLQVGGKKMIYIAYYLDKIGIKGDLCIGGARVSHQHANMIVTDKNATSADIIKLARQMQSLVRDNFGIIPQPECRLVGFDKWPLL